MPCCAVLCCAVLCQVALTEYAALFNDMDAHIEKVVADMRANGFRI